MMTSKEQQLREAEPLEMDQEEDFPSGPTWRHFVGCSCLAISLITAGIVLGIKLGQSETDNRIPCFRPVSDIYHSARASPLPTGPSFNGDYPRMGGLQGLAYDARTAILYQAHTHGLRKMQLDADDLVFQTETDARLYNQTTDFRLIPTADQGDLPIVHFGGIAWIDGQVLLAAHTELLADNQSAAGGVVVGVDAETLAPVPDIFVAHNPYQANDWVAVDPVTRVGYAGTFFNVTRVLRFDVDTQRALPALDLSGGPADGVNFIQSAIVFQSSHLLLATNDFQTSLFYVDIETGRVVGRQSMLLGNEMDGLVQVADDKLLMGFNRAHSHEHERLLSVVLLEAVYDVIQKGQDSYCGGAYVRFEN